jgi:hypothetical protein
MWFYSQAMNIAFHNQIAHPREEGISKLVTLFRQQRHDVIHIQIPSMSSSITTDNQLK